MKKVIWVLCLCLFLTGCSSVFFNGQDRGQTTERINYKLFTDDTERNKVLIKTDKNSIELTLKATPYISSPMPVLYTLFLHGKQIKAYWDGSEEPEYLFQTVIKPEQEKLIKIKIPDLQEGTNILNLSSVVFPYKYDIPEEEFLSYKWSMDAHSFTVIVNEEKHNSSLDFAYNERIISKVETITGVAGELSYKKDDLYLKDEPYKLNVTKTLYYHWRNDYSEPVNVRLSLLVDWKQVPWDTNELFIDTLAYPGDVIIKEINLPEIMRGNSQSTSAISVIAFINPGESFWYLDESENDIKARYCKGQAFSTRRAIVKQ